MLILKECSTFFNFYHPSSEGSHHFPFPPPQLQSRDPQSHPSYMLGKALNLSTWTQPHENGLWAWNISLPRDKDPLQPVLDLPPCVRISSPVADSLCALSYALGYSIWSISLLCVPCGLGSFCSGTIRVLAIHLPCIPEGLAGCAGFPVVLPNPFGSLRSGLFALKFLPFSSALPEVLFSSISLQAPLSVPQ